MSEAKKEEKKPVAAEKKEKAPAVKSHPKPDRPHHLKITQMSLQQVEEAISVAQKHMGGLHSMYARALMARRDFLSQQHSRPMQKAA